MAAIEDQIFLGDDDFVNDMQYKLNPRQSLKDISKKQTQAPIKPLSYFSEHYKTRDEGMVQAYWSEHYTLAQVGEHFGATVSRALKEAEKRRDMSNVKPNPEF